MRSLERIIRALVLVAFLAFATSVGAQGPAPGQPAKIAPELGQALEVLPAGERLPVIVTFRTQADLRHLDGGDRAERLERVVATLQGTANTTQAPIRALLQDQRLARETGAVTFFWIFNGLSLSASAQAIAALAARPEVRTIALEGTIPAPPELSRSPVETAAESSASASEWNITLIHAPDLWQLGFQGEGIVVANMDTGVSASHPDLATQWRGGTNSWFDPYGEHPTTPTDLNGHGTTTMGVMVGRDAGGTNIGVAPLAQWIAVKIFDDRDRATATAIHQGFQWLLDPDGDPSTPDAPHIVNNSWSLLNTDCDLGFQLDLQALRAAGIVPVFAAGNSGPAEASSVSPGNNPEAFAAGATDDLDVIWSDSARGPSACGEAETLYPEMVAPGVAVRTTDRYGTYQTATGTSLAAPHVAGALALLLNAFPDLTIAEQENGLLAGAVDLGSAGPDNTYGQGRLDVLAAYSWLSGSVQLSISKLDTPDPVEAGATLTYTLSVSNLGPTSASLITVTDELPSGVTYGNAWGDGWDCIQAGQEATCTRASLGAGLSSSIVLTVTAPGDTGRITNTASVLSYEPDVDLGDNIASAGTLIVSHHYIYLPLVLR
jgi:uncharacterized repeat protein (TIGR01451 family)